VQGSVRRICSAHGAGQHLSGTVVFNIDTDERVMNSSTNANEAERLHTSNETVRNENEVSLVDILLVVTRNSRIIGWILFLVVSIGTMYAFIAPDEYTVHTQVVRESDVEAPSGLSGGLSALRGLGISVSGAGSGLTPDSYPEILSSREVRLGVARDTFYFPDFERRMTLVERIQIPTGIVDHVKTVARDLIQQVTGGSEEAPGQFDSKYPSLLELKAAKFAGGFVTSSINVENGLMGIRVTTSSPELSTSVSESYLRHLEQRVRSIRTGKAKQNLEFVDKRFEQVKDELRAAEERLAQFVDRNQNLNSAQLRTERDRLQRQVEFKSDLFSEIQTQRTQAQIELQRVSPVITVVEAPTPPLKPSAPSRILIIVLSAILGGFLGLGVAFLQAFYAASLEDREEEAKFEEVREWADSFSVVRRGRSLWNRFKK